MNNCYSPEYSLNKVLQSKLVPEIRILAALGYEMNRILSFIV